ncbi:hypothetical protein [Dactylosporangium sp. CA-233914]|uniref:hypothetical protein n=1 Tax=Dactylosporangium sp. CA-233914 TaxID=3239934 RepID=UPI003D91F251
MRELREIAADLDRTAERLGASGRPFKDLAGVLGTGDARALAGVDLATAFGPEQLLPDREGAAVGFVELLRDIAILAPPAYTAWRLAEALHAWSGSGASGSFLAGWQQGFGHTVPTLGETGRPVALAVTVAAALTVAARVFRDMRDGRVRRHRVRLSRLISEATLALAVPAGNTARLTQAAATLKASLRSTVDYFAGLTAAARGGADPGLHRNSARLAFRLGLLADDIVDAALAGQDVWDRLEEFDELTGQLSGLLNRAADDESGGGPAGAAARFADAVREVVPRPPADDVVPAPRADLDLREITR